MIKVVTFDVWNTLIEEKDYSAQRAKHLADAMSKLKVQRSYDEIRRAYITSHEYAHQISREENHRYVPPSERLDRILEELSAWLTEDLRAKVLREFEEDVLLDPPLLVEGVRETLESLVPKYRIGIICDSGFTPGRTLRKVLAGHGVLRFFDVTVFSDKTGYNKPHITMFRNALRNLEAEPSEAIHVGDLLHTDIAGAKAAGMKTLWFNRRGTVNIGHYKPDYEIKGLSEVVGILNRCDKSDEQKDR